MVYGRYMKFLRRKNQLTDPNVPTNFVLDEINKRTKEKLPKIDLPEASNTPHPHDALCTYGYH